MCGIVGYIGKKDAFPILIKGLRRLEYRGYDSAGVALINNDGKLNVCKTKGKVDALVEYCSDKNVSGTVGIAHTRWATHGEPSSVNAHPHYSESHNLAIIHNGIIENYAELKEKLKAKGVQFVSDTDTEVLVQLIEYIKEHKQLDLLTAVQVALYQVIGAYAIAILDKRDPDQIIAARKQSPLVVGIGDDEFFLGSDASPIVEYTDKVVYLEDGNIAMIRRGEELHVVSILGEEIERRGYNLYDMCDEINADLEYVISALCESGGVMQAHDIHRPLNIFYIHEVEFENEEFRDMLLTDILINLPDIMFSHTNILPEMMIYYPRPLPYDNRMKELQNAIAVETSTQLRARMEKLKAMEEDPTIDSDYDDEPQLALSKDQINILMGKRVEGDSYPEAAKDLPLWGDYEFAGFSEWKNTRVLYNLDLRREK